MSEKSNNAQTVVVNTDRNKDQAGCWVLGFHIFMTVITGGLWLFVMLGWKVFKSLAN